MTTTRQFKTNLRCSACVAAIKPHLENEPGVHHWEVDLASPDKTLKIHGNATTEALNAALGRAGYKILGEIQSHPEPAHQPVSHAEPHADEKPTSYYPLALVAAFLIGVVALAELRAGGFDLSRAMTNFMGAFFLTFAFFKLLDLRGFADAYRGYDVVARRIPAYGYIYPFIELLLGAAFLTGVWPAATNLATLIVMAVSSVGVIQSLLKKRAIRCACLGTVFNLPMSTITVVEDGLMVAMAGSALFFAGH